MKDNETFLLPMWAQMANMRLSLLRDGVLQGFCDSSDLQSQMGKYLNYGTTWVATATSNAAAQHPGHFIPPNNIARTLQTTVVNFMHLWEFLDPAMYPQPVTNIPVGNEIFYSMLEQVSYLSDRDTGYVIPTSKQAYLDHLDIYTLADDHDHIEVAGVLLNYADSSAPIYSGYYGPSTDQPPPVGEHHNYIGEFSMTRVAVNPADPITRIDGNYSLNNYSRYIQFTTKTGVYTKTIPYIIDRVTATTWPVSLCAPRDYWLSSMWMPYEHTNCVFGFRNYAYRPAGVPLVGIQPNGWQHQGLPLKGSEKWVAGYSVQYTFSYMYNDNTPNSNPGYWCDPITNSQSALPTLILPATKNPKVAGRKIWRKFAGRAPECVGQVMDDVTVSFTDNMP